MMGGKWLSSCCFVDGHTSVGQQIKAYIHQLYADTRCHLEDPLKAMTDREQYKRVKGESP